ncbi:hypothetical protein [Rhizobium sp. Root483D2]|uniref:hypothetical protein n=1 Tax=Rhizobium sp. Root483D2 TaxID=1736545 RepID=UPI000715FB54|nr:hypothetical protein [Rhizobium sp. Root483D2]KQY23858.1 hypothetical protein ASD32_26975 [Rhizobium sp. Root483D2]
MTGFSRMLFPVLAIAGVACLSLPVLAQDTDDEDYKPVLPDVGIYKAMLDANKQTGWIQFRNYDDKQLIYFTALQTMHCRLSEIRYSINSDALDKRFPLGTCNPQIPFNLPDSDTNEYIYISLPAGEAKTLAIQAVWDDGAGSEIVVYKPCEGVGDATCAAIKTIKRPKKQMQEPVASDSPIRAVQSETPGKTFVAPPASSAARP